MRATNKIKGFIFILFTFCIIGVLTGCYAIKEENYYSDKNNFITGSAKVENIIYDKETAKIYFWLEQIDEAYQDSTFKVEGKNVDILFEKNVFDTIKIGDEIIFTSAPGYFGDGYCMPIVAISYKGEELLSFEEGYENLMNLY